MNKSILVIFLSITFVSLANSAHFRECANNASSTVDLRECLAKELQHYDEELNSIYRNLQKLLTQKEQILLKQAQRSWLKFRSAECDFAAFHEHPGTIAPIIISSCYIEMTKTRVMELNKYILQYQN